MRAATAVAAAEIVAINRAVRTSRVYASYRYCSIATSDTESLSYFRGFGDRGHHGSGTMDHGGTEWRGVPRAVNKTTAKRR